MRSFSKWQPTLAHNLPISHTLYTVLFPSTFHFFSLRVIFLSSFCMTKPSMPIFIFFILDWPSTFGGGRWNQLDRMAKRSFLAATGSEYCRINSPSNGHWQWTTMRCILHMPASRNAITLIQNLCMAICPSASLQKSNSGCRRAAASNLSTSSNTFRSSKMKENLWPSVNEYTSLRVHQKKNP